MITRHIRQIIKTHRPKILALLRQLVVCNSYVHNKTGVDAVGMIVTREMPAFFSHRVVKNNTFGDHHIFSHIIRGTSPIVLAGHLDTLCPADKFFDRLIRRGDRLVGPGVNDMKGGIVVIIWALKILEECGLLSRQSIVCIFNSDEEVGSPTSRGLFFAMRGKAQAALVFECGGTAGTVVTARKGVTRYRLHIEGRPAHFGNLKGPKVSAVQEAAHKTIAIEALNRSDKSVVSNVGRIVGGLAANAVPEKACMDFEIRYWDARIGEEAIQNIKQICSRPTVPGCVLKLEQLSARAPMQPTPHSMRLFRRIQEVGAALGQKIVAEKRGGVSDACSLSQAGIPTIDGLGPLGDGDFTRNEFIVTETLFQRIELAVHLILSLSERGINDTTG